MNNYQQEIQRFYRTFVLEDQSTLKTQVFPFEVWTDCNQVDLFPMLSKALDDLKNLNFKIYDFRLNKYIELQTIGVRFHVPKYIVEEGPHVVLIKFCTNNSQTMSMNSYQKSINHDNKSEVCSKSQRSKQRIILEVIQIVKKWRNLHENKKGKTMTLPQAADLLGLPKKSLDDYYYQLRMGQKYGFDFHSHMMDGIGTLRAFLKRFKNNRRGDKTEKLPNNLRISDDIGQYQDLIKSSQKHIREEIYQRMDIQRQELGGCQQTKKDSIEGTFYNEFNYDFAKQTDPFLNLGKGSQNKSMMNLDLIDGGNFDLFF